MPTSHGRSRGALAMTLLTAVLVAACVPNAGLPETCHDPAVSFEATLVRERLEPATFDACREQQVSITITIERDGILHLHGYDDQEPAIEVRAGDEVTFDIQAVRSGAFPIALHTTDGPAEVTVGTLTVHEP
jgi:hypothetical protein